MDRNVVIVLILAILLNLIPLVYKIHNNKIKVGTINFINSSILAIIWIVFASYFRNQKYVYTILLYGLIVFQLVFLYNKFLL